MVDSLSKKILGIALLILIVGVFSFNTKITPEKAYQELDNYLYQTYGEEFVIDFFGERGRGYEAGRVFPKSYLGTDRQYDSYYWGQGFVELVGKKFEAGDTYGRVLLNESANNFYLPKLKELFGENVLPILNVEGQYDEIDFTKEMKIRKEAYEKEPDLNYFPLSGGIYIFGRVENNKDREWYRKQIYEFVQFMKQTGTFEYVRLSIYIIDERMLVNGAEKCFKNIKYTSKTRKGITKEIDKALNLMTEEYNKLTTQEKLIKLSSYNKGNILNEIRGILLLVPIASPKYIDSNSFSDDEIAELFGRKKEYNNINDIQFKYEDYAIKEVKNE